MKTKLIVFLVLIILLSVLILQNTQVVNVKVFFWKISMSRALLYPLIFLFGIVTGWIGCLFYKRNNV